jgi:hypothetical protein
MKNEILPKATAEGTFDLKSKCIAAVKMYGSTLHTKCARIYLRCLPIPCYFVPASARDDTESSHFNSPSLVRRENLSPIRYFPFPLRVKPIVPFSLWERPSRSVVASFFSILAKARIYAPNRRSTGGIHLSACGK